MMICAALLLSAFQKVKSADCHSTGIEFPSGFSSTSDGTGILLSGIASDGTYIYSGGQHDDPNIFEGSAFQHADGIPFLHK